MNETNIKTINEVIKKIKKQGYKIYNNTLVFVKDENNNYITKIFDKIEIYNKNNLNNMLNYLENNLKTGQHINLAFYSTNKKFFDEDDILKTYMSAYVGTSKIGDEHCIDKVFIINDNKITKGKQSLQKRLIYINSKN